MASSEPGPAQRPALPPEGEVPGPIYLLVAGTIAVLTLFGVAAAYVEGVSHVVLAVILLVCAAVGVALELLYYMHLRVASGRRLYTLFFASGLGFAVLMAGALAVLLQYAIPSR